MRGYERLYASALLLRLISYESPCGVMSGITNGQSINLHQLRIPMRGYEPEWDEGSNLYTLVTNPHAGL